MRTILPLALCALPWASAQADTPLDGRYTGERTIVRGAPPNCPVERQVVWHITDHQFSYRFWTANLPLQVAPDGTFKGQMQYSPGHGRTSWLRVTGTISNGSLQADAEWRSCQMHYSLRLM